MKRRKFIIAGIIVVMALGFLGYQGFVSSATYYYKVSEFVGQQSSFADSRVRVEGIVADGTIDRQGSTLRFTITDGQQSLPVMYKGVVPDSFKAGGDAVVEGKLDSAGIFQATTLLAKCPSKYEPATEQPK